MLWQKKLREQQSMEQSIADKLIFQEMMPKILYENIRKMLIIKRKSRESYIGG